MKKRYKLILSLLLLSIVTYTSASAVRFDCEVPPLMAKLATDFGASTPLKELFKRTKNTATSKKLTLLAEVWKSLEEGDGTKDDPHPYKRKDIELLELTISHLSQEPFKTDAGLRSQYMDVVKAYKGSIPTKTGYGHPDYDSLPESYAVYFNELFKYIKNFNDKSGFDLSEAKGIGIKQDGFYLSMRYMNAKFAPGQITRIDQSFVNTQDCATSTCRMDLQIKNAQGEKVQYEFKSYSKGSKLKQINQLVQYLGEAEDLGSFKYVFNESKLNLGEARAKMTEFIDRNKQAVFDGMSAGLRGALFGSTVDLTLISSSDLTPEVIDRMVNEIVEVF